jgi:hypothetical protein
MDRGRTLQILRDYGVGERILLMLSNFWDSLTVVARQQGYYSKPFRSERGTTQGDIASPTIFNILVDAVVREWYHQLRSEGIDDVVRAIFYADDGHIYSSDADALQKAADLIVDIFERVGLKANPTKTKAMICAPNPSVIRISSPAYQRRMNDPTAPTHRERKRLPVECDICHTTVQSRNLVRHKRAKHGINKTTNTQQQTPPYLSADGETYTVSMPSYHDPTPCPVPGCNTIIRDRYGMRRHFVHRHFQDTIIILEEGQLARCTDCGMFCTLLALTTTHRESKICKKGAKRNKQKQRDLQCIRAFRQTFTIQNQPIETVTNFTYLGRIITSRDEDWIAAHSNLQKARTRWAMIQRVLARETASQRISAMFYKATIQTVLLYGSETWVITDEILRLLTAFHHSVARRITNRHPRPVPDTDEWIYPSIQETLRQAGMFTIEEYLQRRRKYLEQHASQLQILQECQQALQTERPTRRRNFWWKQPLSNLPTLPSQP